MRQSFSHSSEFNSSTAASSGIRAPGLDGGRGGGGGVGCVQQRRGGVCEGEKACNEKTLQHKKVIGLQKRMPRDLHRRGNIIYIIISSFGRRVSSNITANLKSNFMRDGQAFFPL